MSTRCNIIVKDQHDAIQLYRDCDGYPQGEHGVVAQLPQALPFAWELPRFEAADFAAAIVRAWKREGGGNVHIDGIADPADLTARLHGDIEYLYVIEPPEKGKKAPIVRVCQPDGPELWAGHVGDAYPKGNEGA